jgi:hypothetical protein
MVKVVRLFSRTELISTRLAPQIPDTFFNWLAWNLRKS